MIEKLEAIKSEIGVSIDGKLVDNILINKINELIDAVNRLEGNYAPVAESEAKSLTLKRRLMIFNNSCLHVWMEYLINTSEFGMCFKCSKCGAIGKDYGLGGSGIQDTGQFTFHWPCK